MSTPVRTRPACLLDLLGPVRDYVGSFAAFESRSAFRGRIRSRHRHHGGWSMMRIALVLGLCATALPGCVSQSTWTPTVDTYGSSRAQFVTRDQAECRQLAMQVSGSTTGQTAQGAV